MKTHLINLLIIFIFITPLYSQTNDSLKTIPLDFQADNIDVDIEGNIYLLQRTGNHLYKFYKAYQYDSIQRVGGAGTGQQAFNYPTGLSVINRQEVYVLDQQNRRLILLNTNLRPIRILNFAGQNYKIPEKDSEVEIYPSYFALGKTGEMFIVNSIDNQIFKFNQQGQLEMVFGGNNYGEGSFYQVSNLLVSNNNDVFIVDSAEQQIVVYNNFGVYQYKIPPFKEFKWKDCTLKNNQLVFWNDISIYEYDINKNKLSSFVIANNSEAISQLIDIEVLGNNWYILTKKSVILRPE